jgi:hypothetical protein
VVETHAEDENVRQHLQLLLYRINKDTYPELLPPFHVGTTSMLAWEDCDLFDVLHLAKRAQQPVFDLFKRALAAGQPTLCIIAACLPVQTPAGSSGAPSSAHCLLVWLACQLQSRGLDCDDQLPSTFSASWIRALPLKPLIHLITKAISFQHAAMVNVRFV